MDADAIRALVEATVKASTESAVAAAVQAVHALPRHDAPGASSIPPTAPQEVRLVARKVEMPAFDRNNVEIWIKRVESAFTRANIVTAKEKFAQMEAKFSVDVDPVINDYLYGDPTDSKWTKFLDHLRDLYGRTKKQQVQFMLSNPSRDGRRPTSHFSHIMDRIGKITIDDLVKEHIMNGLPVEIRRQLADKSEKVSAQELAKMADDFFDKEGRPLHSSASTSVNHVASTKKSKDEPQQPRGTSTASSTAAATSTSRSTTPASTHTPAFEDEEPDVNAVRFKNGQRQNFNVSNRSSTAASRGRGFSRGNGPRTANSNARYSNNNDQGISPKVGIQGGNKVCKFHNRYGDQARSCEEGCMLFASHKSSAPKGQPSQRT